MVKKKRTQTAVVMPDERYGDVLASMVSLLESARRVSARAVNSVMTATYWEIGRRIVELEQEGRGRADYGEVLIKQLAIDLTRRFGRGFSWRNLYLMQGFFRAYPDILQTPSAISETVSEYRLALPDEATLVAELENTQRQLARKHTF